jgi:hypothetical protein
MHKNEVLSVFTFDIGALCFASGRSNDWVKKTCVQRETPTIAGFALDGGKWDGIYVGRRSGDDLVYAGKVDHGFDKASAADLQKRLKPLIRKTQPYTKWIAHKGIWVEPKLLAEIEYRAKSAEGKVGTRSSRVCGRSVMDAFDRFWQWADKPLDSGPTIPAELDRARYGRTIRPREGELRRCAGNGFRTMSAGGATPPRRLGTRSPRRQAKPGIEDDRAADSRASPVPSSNRHRALPSGSAAPPWGARGLEAEPRRPHFCFAARRINPSPARVFQGFRVLENPVQCCLGYDSRFDLAL